MVFSYIKKGLTCMLIQRKMYCGHVTMMNQFISLRIKLEIFFSPFVKGFT